MQAVGHQALGMGDEAGADLADDENEIDGDADPGRPPGQPMAAGLAGVAVVMVMQALAHGVFADGGFGAAARLIYTGS